jgi:hypothetical protein
LILSNQAVKLSKSNTATEENGVCSLLRINGELYVVVLY